MLLFVLMIQFVPTRFVVTKIAIGSLNPFGGSPMNSGYSSEAKTNLNRNISVLNGAAARQGSSGVLWFIRMVKIWRAVLSAHAGILSRL